MRNLCVLLCATMMVCFVHVHSQDMFPVTRLTFDPAPEAFPTWAPDGKSIVYSHIFLPDSAGKSGLWKISLESKKAEQIFAGLAEHPEWSPDGRYIVFDGDTGASIRMIPAGGGAPISILPDSILIRNGGLPCWSPDGSQIAFLERRGLSLCVLGVATGRATSIFRQEGMLPLPGCWSRDGKSILISLTERQTRKSTIWQISSDGKEKKQIIGHHEGFFRHLALSPDGTLLVYAAREGRYMGLWIMPAEGGKSIPLAASQPGHNEGASWSPDGKRIAFNSTRSGNFDVWMMDVNADEIREKLFLK